MGIFDRATGASPPDDLDEQYVCLSCERRFELQYHSCPVCGGYDVRREKWVSLEE
ncbi:MAG: hypothetical protein ABEI96_11835 [Haloarculaceae archaeon]